MRFEGVGCNVFPIESFAQILHCIESSEQDNERYHVDDQRILHPEWEITSGHNAVDAQSHSAGKLELLVSLIAFESHARKSEERKIGK